MKSFATSIPINLRADKLFKSPWESPEPEKFPMNDECYSVTRKFCICTKDPDETEDSEAFKAGIVVEGYFIIVFYDDGYPGMLSIYVGKEGSDLHGAMLSLSKAISMLLQYGVRPDKIYDKLLYDEYEPKGISNVPEAIICKSVIDLVLKYMRVNCFPTANQGRNSNYDEMIVSVVDISE